MSATSCLYVTCPLKALKIPYKIPEDTRTNATIPSTYPIKGTASSSIGPITSQINVLKNGKIIERGTYKELMAKMGELFRMENK